MFRCYLGIGSNLGDRTLNIKQALKKLKESGIRVTKKSSLYQTRAIGGPRQRMFLNAVVEIKTDLPPLMLLQRLKRIENELGRKKTVRYGPRIIDLDILLYADKKINRNDLKIPHPRMWKRDFVLRPLREIAPRLFIKA